MLLTTMFCPRCQEEKEIGVVAGQYPAMCSECEEQERRDAKDKHLASLKFLTIEERLARIEEMLYDMQHTKPISEVF